MILGINTNTHMILGINTNTNMKLKIMTYTYTNMGMNTIKTRLSRVAFNIAEES